MKYQIPHILLVEDDQLDVINVQRSLSKINLTHKLLVAKNGEEALALLKGEGAEKLPSLPDIIMLDINMPKMDGLEFLGILRTEDTFKDIKVFIMTTSNEAEDIEASRRLGISGYIVKPLSLNSSCKDSFSLLIDLMNLKN